MNNEIKDLKCLGALGNLQSFAIDGTKGSKIVDINVNIVKDYIINLQQKYDEANNAINWWSNKAKELQQENERLKENNQAMQEEMARTWEKCDDYKSRCEKAIEYYKTHQQECVIGRNKDERLIKDYYLPAQCSKVLLNILQNGSDSQC